MKRIWRYAPYAFIVWFARRKLERFQLGEDVIVTLPFTNELIGWNIKKEEPTC